MALPRKMIDSQIVCSDAFEFLRGLEHESIDLFLTDPPYESLEKHRKIGTTTRLKNSKSSSNNWFGTIPNDSFPELFGLMFYALKPNRHLYLYCDDETSDIAVADGKAAGFKFWKRIVWDKQRLGMGYHYRNCHEFVLLFEKGKRKLNGWSTLRSIQYVKAIRGGWPTEKPIDLASTFIEASTESGELVCDPFCGSGSNGIAALELERSFLLGDIDPEAVRYATRRIHEATGRASKESPTAPVDYTAAQDT